MERNLLPTKATNGATRHHHTKVTTFMTHYSRQHDDDMSHVTSRPCCSVEVLCQTFTITVAGNSKGGPAFGKLLYFNSLSTQRWCWRVQRRPANWGKNSFRANTQCSTATEKHSNEFYTDEKRKTTTVEHCQKKTSFLRPSFVSANF